MFTSPNGGFEFPLFWAAALLAQILLGPGAFALRDVGPLETVPSPMTSRAS
jgi:putative oxidoreductase